jgi:hypothetical protein
MADSWSSVQIVTVIVDAATPVTVAVLGVIFARASGKIEQVQWANQTLVTRRLQIFDKLAPGLNQLLCFATFVGVWKEIHPRQAIAIKRDLDQIMYANKVLFSDELFTAYQEFMTSLFLMFATTDADALVRAPISHTLGDRRKLDWWEDVMTRLFSVAEAIEIEMIKEAYDALSQQFRSDLYVTNQGRRLLVGQS